VTPNGYISGEATKSFSKASDEAMRTAMPVTGIAPLLKRMIADYAATGLPPAYLPTAEKDD